MTNKEKNSVLEELLRNETTNMFRVTFGELSSKFNIPLFEINLFIESLDKAGLIEYRELNRDECGVNNTMKGYDFRDKGGFEAQDQSFSLCNQKPIPDKKSSKRSIYDIIDKIVIIISFIALIIGLFNG